MRSCARVSEAACETAVSMFGFRFTPLFRKPPPKQRRLAKQPCLCLRAHAWARFFERATVCMQCTCVSAGSLLFRLLLLLSGRLYAVHMRVGRAATVSPCVCFCVRACASTHTGVCVYVHVCVRASAGPAAGCSGRARRAARRRRSGSRRSPSPASAAAPRPLPPPPAPPAAPPCSAPAFCPPPPHPVRDERYGTRDSALQCAGILPPAPAPRA